MSLGKNNLNRVKPGDLLSDNIGNAAFVNTIIEAIKDNAGLFEGQGERSTDNHYLYSEYDETTAIEFLPVADHDTVALGPTELRVIESRRLFSARAEPEAGTSAYNLDHPRLIATLKRGHDLYTTGDSYSDGRAPFYAKPIGLTPVPLEGVTSAPSPWVAGLPCGREENGTKAEPGRGGLICVRKPDRNGIVWAIKDTINQWTCKVLTGSTEAFAGDPLTEWQDIELAFVAPYSPGTTDAEALDDLELTLGRATARYRTVGGTITAGDYVTLSWVNGEWGILVGSGGGGGSSDGCCCCEAVTAGDVVEYSNGVYSTFFRVLCEQLGDITHKQLNGTLRLTFPAPEGMILEKQDDVDTLEWDMPESVFSGTYNDGDTVDPADILTPTGKVSFIHYVVEGEEGACNCPIQRMRVEWDAEIPVKPEPTPIEEEEEEEGPPP